MLQAARNIVFLLIFASTCSLAIPDETSNSTVLAHSEDTLDDVTTTTTTTIKFITTTVHYENEKAESSSETIERSSNEMVTASSENKRKKEGHTDCHLAEETKDMLNCFFLTDDATTQLAENASRNTSDEMGRKALKFNDTYPPKIFPQDKDVKSINNADEATRRRLNHTFYTIVTPGKIVNASAMDRAESEVTNTMSPASKTNNIQDTSFRNDSEIASQKFAKDEGMSGGMIALTMTLTFVITIAIIYASVIAYKRYLDYRCNRRQLLDNDSEFDANDLHHFEL